MLIGGLVCAAAAPLYIPAWRSEKRGGRARTAATSDDDADEDGTTTPPLEVSDSAA
jgi:hypothetical protein